MLSDILTIVIVGAMISAIYALIAIGFTMIFGVGGILNLTHGALLMLSAYTYLVAQPYVGRLGGVIAGVLVAALASYGVYMGLVRYIEEHVVITFMATIMAALAIQEAITMGFSQQARVLEPMVPGSIAVAGTRMQYDQLLAFVVSWVLIGLLWYYVTNTKNGRAILATSMSERGAIFTGVDLPQVRRQTWLIAGAFAGVGGLFIGRLQQTSPEMWLEPLTLAFIIVIIGGVGSIKGSIIAAYLIGYIETLTVELIGAPYRVVIALLIIIAVIMYRPEGLYGREYLE
ncbi:branched-chain amino acid ABC transporter permease [Natrinema sp. SYSU A 869]|uniref:branched-chain amino acid ABC transporter permease n=1 Tax=Natrinema sp. SYSU A 869 TaxID=2871694 RepID=UPI001CA3A06C|nr:branched-chain amino acid ABC transporter permease [Natrinema sp. SYSU A 869]